MKNEETLWGLLRNGADADIAVAAPGRPPLSYAGLRSHVTAVLRSLRAFGIGRGDRVAIVLPNGPEMATAFVAIGAGAITAPLNPAYRSAEFEFYLSDLGATTLVVASGDASPAIDVANRLQMDVVNLSVPDDAPAGIFHLSSGRGRQQAANAEPCEYAAGGDPALVLHTSGTTSRPKIVPLRQAQLYASARHVRRTLALTKSDRCLNIMPLFHIHGLIAAVLASLAAGASVACSPGFDALRFFTWLRELRPTWYTAVPTMHQLILARAPRNAAVIRQNPLRFLRSSSASLAPRTMAELEEVFAAPVIESYGMTEAAHQMTSNPLPPGRRKPGTVGAAAGPDVAVMDGKGNLLARNEIGEVVIRGPNVFSGYENNPQANRDAFAAGWFRTGDQGVFDDDGYLTLTGRLKELINRGGEKISPREVDEVLMAHPAVAQAVTFAVPHDMLGEDVAAAVVLRPSARAEAGELRAFTAERLASFKVPRRLLIVDEIPKSPTGKLRRIGLAAKLGLA